MLKCKTQCNHWKELTVGSNVSSDRSYSARCNYTERSWGVSSEKRVYYASHCLSFSLSSGGWTEFVGRCQRTLSAGGRSLNPPSHPPHRPGLWSRLHPTTQWWRARSTASSFKLWWTSLLCVSAFCLRFSAWAFNVQSVLSMSLLQKRHLLCLKTAALNNKPRSRKRLQLVKDFIFVRTVPQCGLCLLKVCFVIDCERNWNDHYTCITLDTKSLSWDQHYVTFTTKLRYPCQQSCCFAASLL